MLLSRQLKSLPVSVHMRIICSGGSNARVRTRTASRWGFMVVGPGQLLFLHNLQGNCDILAPAPRG